MSSKIDCVFPFGRYKGELVSDVYEIAPHYLKWVIENCPNISDNLLQTIEYHID